MLFNILYVYYYYCIAIDLVCVQFDNKFERNIYV